MSVRIAKFVIEGQAPLVYGRPVNASRGNEETPDQFEQRTCLMKVYTNPEGFVAVNTDAIKRSLEWAASWRNEKVPGGAGGKATFKKRFTAGVQPLGPCATVSNGKEKLKPGDLDILELYTSSKGERGGTTRVWKMFPRVNPPWTVECEMMVLDTAIDEAIFRKHLETAGLFDGLGSMRVGRGGPNGRFVVTKLSFREAKL